MYDVFAKSIFEAARVIPGQNDAPRRHGPEHRTSPARRPFAGLFGIRRRGRK